MTKIPKLRKLCPHKEVMREDCWHWISWGRLINRLKHQGESCWGKQLAWCVVCVIIDHHNPFSLWRVSADNSSWNLSGVSDSLMTACEQFISTESPLGLFSTTELVRKYDCIKLPTEQSHFVVPKPLLRRVFFKCIMWQIRLKKKIRCVFYFFFIWVTSVLFKQKSFKAKE